LWQERSGHTQSTGNQQKATQNELDWPGGVNSRSKQHPDTNKTHESIRKSGNNTPHYSLFSNCEYGRNTCHSSQTCQPEPNEKTSPYTSVTFLILSQLDS